MAAAKPRLLCLISPLDTTSSPSHVTNMREPLETGDQIMTFGAASSVCVNGVYHSASNIPVQKRDSPFLIQEKVGCATSVR